MADRIFQGDTATVEAYLYAEDGVTPLTVSQAEIEVKRPDGATLKQVLGGVGTTELEAAWNDTSQVGLYQGRVRFTLTGGALKSVPFTFEVVNPFETTANVVLDKIVYLNEEYDLPVSLLYGADWLWYTVAGGGASTVNVEHPGIGATLSTAADPGNVWSGQTVEYAVAFRIGGYESMALNYGSITIPTGSRPLIQFPVWTEPIAAVIYRKINNGAWFTGDQLVYSGGGNFEDTVAPNDELEQRDPIFIAPQSTANLRLAHDAVGTYTITVRYYDSNAQNERGQVFTIKVTDPLDVTSEAVEGVVDGAWTKLEDLFDSELGGPWLRDKTLQIVDREKIKRFLPDALYNIGATYQPVSSYTEDNFPYNPHSPLLSQALLVEAIRHLIRSYVEQPNPIGGGNITYFDRRDYLNRWQQILQSEEQRLLGWIDLFKKEQMGYGSTATLLGGYSNVYGRSPRYMRGRYPYVHVRW